jgi:hypothetical protein
VSDFKELLETATDPPGTLANEFSALLIIFQDAKAPNGRPWIFLKHSGTTFAYPTLRRILSTSTMDRVASQ